MRTERRGFTILELLVSLGVLVLVAVAVATIFTSVGDTVNAGRRLSQLNRYAAQLERTMREDFERMSRDGFLVIRNEHALRDQTFGPGPSRQNLSAPAFQIPRNADDAAPRPRRVDQIMFFTRGQFVSARSPVVAGLQATAGEARLWYGHGQRRVPERDQPNGPYLLPSPADDLSSQIPTLGDFRETGSRLGFDPGPGVVNPNEFAADWTLLRHVTLLTPAREPVSQPMPRFSREEFFGIPVNFDSAAPLDPASRLRLADAAFQISMQPAVSSVFWNIQPLSPTLPDTSLPGYVEGFSGQPRWIAGVYGPNRIAAARTSSGLIDIATTTLEEIELIATSADFDAESIATRAAFEQRISSGAFPATVASSLQQWRWMVNALPTPPLSVSQAGGLNGGYTSARIRTEPLPPNLDLASDAGGRPTPPGWATVPAADRLLPAVLEADQEMLTRSAFVPRCTEFIVEWSFGTVDPALNTADPGYGQILWYGMDRWDERNNDWVRQPADERLIARLYEPRTVLPPGTTTPDPQRGLLTGNTPVLTPNLPETVAFGYVDTAAGGARDTWPWPRLIRVTMSFADPNDPDIEQTYQMVFEVPQQ